mgnify:CR=1 FL=1
MWKPRRCHIHKLTCPREKSLKLSESSVAADGSLLFIVQIQHERHNAGNGTDGSKDRQNHLRNMYRLPRKVFPWELPTSLHSAQHGMAGNRLLPHTVYKGGKNSTWTVGFHLKSIIQYSVVLSNKLRHLRFLKVPRERMFGTGVKITDPPLTILYYCVIVWIH